MKQVVLLIGHGSKDPEGNAEFAAFTREAGVRYCMLDYVEPSIPTAFGLLDEEGIESVLVIPYFLFAGRHVKHDIPSLIKEVQVKYPEMNIKLGKHIGREEALLQVARDRLGPLKNPSAQAVLLVGRGSLKAEVIAEMEWVTQGFRALTGYEHVHHCFIALSTPDLQTGVSNCRAQGAESIIVLPYFLFSGVLVKQINPIARELGCEVRPHLGNHQKLIQLVHQRRDEMCRG